jgi:hypothetical protein
MGRLLEYVLAHEVGHTIGFQHNMKSSSQYPLDSIRNPDFLRRMGHVATLMDYSRFNYVVQPEDHVPAELLIPRIGPYDIWATHWVRRSPRRCRSRNGAPTATRRRAVRSAGRSARCWTSSSKPWLRFSTSGAFGSIRAMRRAVGDADATGLGFKNLRRNMQWISRRRSGLPRPRRAAELYNREIGEYRTELGHVANLVGGMNSQESTATSRACASCPCPGEAARGDEVPRREFLPDADVAHRHGHPPQDQPDGESRVRRAVLGDQRAAPATASSRG